MTPYSAGHKEGRCGRERLGAPAYLLAERAPEPARLGAPVLVHRSSKAPGYADTCHQAIARARRLVLRLFGAARLRRSCLCTACGPAARVAHSQSSRAGAPESGREALDWRLNTSMARSRLPSPHRHTSPNQSYGTHLPASAQGTGSTRRCAGTGSLPYAASAWRGGQPALGVV